MQKQLRNSGYYCDYINMLGNPLAGTASRITRGRSCNCIVGRPVYLCSGDANEAAGLAAEPLCIYNVHSRLQACSRSALVIFESAAMAHPFLFKVL